MTSSLPPSSSPLPPEALAGVAPKAGKTPRAGKLTAATASAPAPSYEAALEELERLVSQLDAGQLPLDQLLTHYQRGAELLAFCKARLEAVENQIQVLENDQIKPWDGA